MDFAASITTKQDDELRILISTIDRSLFPVSIDNLLGDIEIWEVVVERIRASRTLSFASLMQIAEVIGHLMTQNENVIIYFYCDDKHDVYRRNEKLLPQQYRSILFSRLFERYINQRQLTHFIDSTILLRSETDIYIHLIFKKEHQHIAYILSAFLSEMAIK